MANNNHELAEEIVKTLSDRYGISPHRVVDAVKWVEDRIESSNRTRTVSVTAVVGVVIASMALALWEGLRHLIVTGR